MSIFSKILKIQNEVKELVRNEENKFQKYHFFNELQILRLLKPLLDKYNLSILMSDDSNFPLIHERTESEHVVKYLKKILIVDVEASSDSNEKTAEFSF
jgi:hypothetical protein